VLPEFYADSTSSRRTVTSVSSYSSLMVGWNVCHRGETTGYSCGQVKSKNFVPPWGCGEGAAPRVTTSGSKLRETTWRAILETAGAVVPQQFCLRDNEWWFLGGNGSWRLLLRCIHVSILHVRRGSRGLGRQLTVVQSPRQLSSANSLGKHTRMVRSDPRLLVTILLVIVMTLAVVACSRANEEPTNEPVLPTQEPANIPVLPTTEHTNEPVLPTIKPTKPEGDGPPAGPGALLSGELVATDRCLYLVDERGTRWLPAFYAGTVSWERDALVLYGQRFEIGERIWVGGGEASGDLPFLQEPHDSCDIRNVWAHITTVDRERPTRSSP
jgi:hypothetical protein